MSVTTLTRVAVGAALLCAVAVSAVPPGPGAVDRASPPAVVDAHVLRQALSSRRPSKLALTDEIRHFQERLATRGNEAFSHARLFSAYSLRHRAYGRSEDLAAAHRHLDALARHGSHDLTVERATAHLTAHEFDAARRTLSEAPDPGTDLSPISFDVAWASGDYERATGLLEGSWDRGSVAYLAREARLLDGLGRVGEARDTFRRVVELTRAWAEPAPVRAWALVELGHFEHHAGDPEAGVARFLEALEVLPGSPAALEGLAGIAGGVDRRPDVAATLYRRALAHGAHLEVMLSLADAMEAAGDSERASAVRRAFVTRASVHPDVERDVRRPLAQLMSDDPTTLDRALALARADLADRRDAGAWITLAWALRQEGAADGAAAAAERATAWGSPEPAIAYKAGVIAQEAGDRPRAERLLWEALGGRSELTLDEVADAGARLDRLR